MQVNSISSQSISGPSAEQHAAVRASQTEPDQAEFTKSRNLDRSLVETPEIRGGEVGRAKVLASSVQYPPEELIDRISNLLARHWNHSAE
jgi:hypothetical protein